MRSGDQNTSTPCVTPTCTWVSGLMQPSHTPAPDAEMCDKWTFEMDLKCQDEGGTSHLPPAEQTGRMSRARSVNTSLSCTVSVTWWRSRCWCRFSGEQRLGPPAWKTRTVEATLALHPNFKWGPRKQAGSCLFSTLIFKGQTPVFELHTELHMTLEKNKSVPSFYFPIKSVNGTSHFSLEANQSVTWESQRDQMSSHGLTGSSCWHLLNSPGSPFKE